MSCRDAYKLLSLYLDGQVSDSTARQLETHVAGCVKCQARLDLMKQIPVVLQSDKLLAPSEDFTKLVMQRVVMQRVVVSRDDQNGSSFSSYSRTEITYVNTQARQAHTSKLKTRETEAEDEPGHSAQIINLDGQRDLRRPVPGTYMLRFTSVAAALVLGFGLVAYMFGVNGATNLTSDTSGRAVMAFADLLTNSFSSPWQVAAGGVVAVTIIVTLWVQLVRMRNRDS